MHKEKDENGSFSVSEFFQRWKTSFLTSVGFVTIFLWATAPPKTNYQKLRLDRLTSLPLQKVDSLNFAEIDAFDPDCRWSNCWDVFNCTKLTVYAPPLQHFYTQADGQITPEISREFYALYKYIAESDFFTPNAETACVRIAPIDLLSLTRLKSVPKLSTILKDLPFWNGGRNWVILSSHSVKDFELETGQAMVATSSLTDFTVRHGFDIPISFYSHFLHPIVESAQEFEEDSARPYDLISLGPFEDSIETGLRSIVGLRHLKLNKCVDSSSYCSITGESYDAPLVMRKARFCLVSYSQKFGFQNKMLAAALGTGCYPIIVGKYSLILPFQDKIDWNEFSTTFRPSDMHKIANFIQALPNDDFLRARERAVWTFDKFFSSMEAVFDGFIGYLHDRLFPHKVNGVDFWNGPIRGVQSPLFLNRIAPDEGFTAVILAYDRIESLFRVIESVAKAPGLKKVLIIWNNQNKAPPAASSFPEISVTIRVIQTKKNVLSNRFYPYDEIETSCVLSIDDDIVMLTADEIQFGYQVWREYPDRLVGYPNRLHLWEEDTKNWKYESEWTNANSMILTGAAFYHKYYSHAYYQQTPAKIVDWVDDHMNCEDILMNFVIANLTAKAPLKVSPRKKFKCTECSQQVSISVDPGHMVERSECINFFVEEFGKMPLKAVEFRADPVLYKDDPEKHNKDNVKLKYPDMGPL